MIPLHDDNPTRHRAYVTLAIVALNVVAFLFWQRALTATDEEQQTFFFCNALIPYEITHQETLDEGGEDAEQAISEQLRVPPGRADDFQREYARACDDKVWWHSLFVAMFLHGGWLHIGSNMLFLWVFGNNVEDKLRPVPYFLFYLGSGVVASFAQIVVGPDSVIPNLGASGAVAGVLGSYLLMFPRRRVLTLVTFFFITAIYLPAALVLGVWFVLQFISGIAALAPQVAVGGGVAFWAHIGGFVFGVLLALLFFPKERWGDREPPRRYDEWRGRPVRGWGERRRRGDNWWS